MTESPALRIGTRGSPLARWQADWVAAQLTALGYSVELVLIKTQGDVRSGPIGAIGGQGVFTKELQRALADGTIDLAVHSLKDLPTLPTPGLHLAAVPPREANSDALVSVAHASLDALPRQAKVGTGSLRRQSQLLFARPDLHVTDIRGNVDTRLAKLDAGEYDAIVLAEAGLKRLGLADRIRQVLPREVVLPAVGQGALGIECRCDDEATNAALKRLDDAATHASVVAERALLAALRGGCMAPVGAWGRMEDGQLRLEAVVLSAHGSERRYAEGVAPAEDAAELGERVAQSLLDAGAGELIKASRML
ncbi:MAG: hydroxymethylbilane synthase [Planctomycetales bacterium]|nr:hydroxymethylbilane synthase [Planctomycetales bacterium]